MKYTIAGILIVDAAILAWAWRNGSGNDLAMMVFALVCVTFFGSMPILLGVLSRRRAARASAAKPSILIRSEGAARDAEPPDEHGADSAERG